MVWKCSFWNSNWCSRFIPYGECRCHCPLTGLISLYVEVVLVCKNFPINFLVCMLQKAPDWYVGLGYQTFLTTRIPPSTTFYFKTCAYLRQRRYSVCTDANFLPAVAPFTTTIRIVQGACVRRELRSQGYTNYFFIFTNDMSSNLWFWRPFDMCVDVVVRVIGIMVVKI